MKQSLTAPPDLSRPDHILPAFGGKLIGSDNGEWGGGLGFKGPDGRIEVLIRDNWLSDPPRMGNVHGIVENPAGIFAFTGLTHLGLNHGSIYIVTRGPDRKIRATLMMELSGKPSYVTKKSDGSTTFLVYQGHRNDRPLYDCLVLVQKAVRPSRNCATPKE